MDLREIGWVMRGLDSSGLGQRPVVGSSKHGNGLSGSINFLEFLE
jgi:hypothetical protein